jgi:hypothetical protein
MMKIIFVVVLSVIGQYALGMGSSPTNEFLNDASETTARLNMFTDEQGYENQQELEEDSQLMEDNIEDERTEELPPEEQIPPIKGPRLN